MGQQQTSPYSHTNHLEELILNDSWEITNTIDLSINSDKTEKYTIKLKSSIPTNCNMCILFPNHPSAKKRVLWTKSYLGHLNTFSTELNNRIQESDRKDLTIVISSGNNCFAFKHFVGRLYLWWGETIKIEKTNQCQPEIINDIPILVETDGKWSTRSVFLFSENQVIQKVNFIEPIHYNLYCCETDPRKFHSKSIVTTMSDNKANQVVEDLVLQNMRELPEYDLPFKNSEEEDGSNKN